MVDSGLWQGTRAAISRACQHSVTAIQMVCGLLLWLSRGKSSPSPPQYPQRSYQQSFYRGWTTWAISIINLHYVFLVVISFLFNSWMGSFIFRVVVAELYPNRIKTGPYLPWCSCSSMMLSLGWARGAKSTQYLEAASLLGPWSQGASQASSPVSVGLATSRLGSWHMLFP